MATASVTYTPESGAAKMLPAFSVQMHDEAGVVGDTCVVRIAGDAEIDKGALAITIENGEQSVDGEYSVYRVRRAFSPDSVEITGRKVVNFREQRLAIIEALQGSSAITAVRHLYDTLNISDFRPQPGSPPSSANTLQFLVRHAAASTETYKDLVNALADYAIYVNAEGEVKARTQTQGTATLGNVTEDTMAFEWDESVSPRDLTSTVQMIGKYTDDPNRREVMGTYPTGRSRTVDSIARFNSLSEFSVGMPIRWLRLLMESASLSFATPGTDAYNVQWLLDIPEDQIAAPARPWGASGEAWVIGEVDHRWLGQGRSYDEMVSGVGEWSTSVSAIPMLTGT